MPRYYFHIRDDKGVIDDEEGQELPDLDAARAEAEASARELTAEYLKSGVHIDDRQIEITDSRGTILAIFKLKDLLN